MLQLLLILSFSAFSAERVYTIHKFTCKNGMSLGLITFQAEPSVTMMTRFCSYSLLLGKSPDSSLLNACQQDETDWVVKCFNQEFVPNCEDRDHRIKLKCFAD